MIQKRKRLFGPEMRAIVKQYLIDWVAMSDLCDECGLQPSEMYPWAGGTLRVCCRCARYQEKWRANAADPAKDAQIARLEAVVAQKDAKLVQKNEVTPNPWRKTSFLEKASGGPLKGRWVSADTRAEVVDYVGNWT